MAKKSGLGRGFDSLFTENAVDTTGVQTLRISEIEPNRDQPRKEFDEQALSELAKSIEEHGLIQPLLVRPLLGGGYQLVAGERRWRACRMAELDEVPVIIKELDDRETMEIALIENLQREDLNPVEEAEGYKYLVDTYGMTQEEVGNACGKSRADVANKLRMLTLPDEILELVKIGELTTGHCKALLGIPEDSPLRELAVKMAQNGASVRAIEKLAQDSKKTAKTASTRKKNKFYTEVELSLAEEMGRKVVVSPGKKQNSGTITVEFYSKEDLENIAKKLGTIAKK